MNQLQAVSWSRQHHGMITHHISSTDGMDTNLTPSALSGHPDTSVTGILLVIKAICLIEDLNKPAGCAAGGILFKAVVNLDHLGVIIRPKDFSRLLGEPEEGIDPDAVIG